MRKELLSIVIIICLCLMGCSQEQGKGDKNNQKSSQQQDEGGDSKSKDPKQVYEMQKVINNMFTKLSGISTKKEENDNMQQGNEAQTGGSQSSSQSESQQGQDKNKNQNDEQGKDNTNSGGSSGEGQSKSTTPKQQIKKQPQETKPSSILLKAAPVKWEETYKMAETLHDTWNSVNVNLVKNNVQSTIIEGFSNNLNDLTNKLIENDRIGAMRATNNMYYYIPFILASYEKNEYMDLLTADYNVRGAYASSEEWNWNDSLNNITKAIKLMENVKNRLNKENILKLDMAIREMSNVINLKNQPLVRIKAKLVFENFENVIGEILPQE